MQRRFPSTTFWLIVRRENSRTEVLTIDPDGDGGKETLPVFSFEEEAKMFLRFEMSGNPSWRVRESTVGELALVLLGPYASVKKVALDPLPVEVGGEAMMSLVSLERERFLLSLVDQSKLSSPPRLFSDKSSAGHCSPMPR